MATEIRFVENEIGKRLEEIAAHQDTVMLKYPGHRVSRKPIQSQHYANCNGVALLNHNVAGLSHYDLENGNPDVYLPQLIEEISTFDMKDLIAVVIGGDKNHFERNIKILEDYGIPIVGEYYDGWMEGEKLRWDLPGKKSKKADKHLVVIPDAQEVLMYSKPVKYTRLYPPRCKMYLS